MLIYQRVTQGVYFPEAMTRCCAKKRLFQPVAPRGTHGTHGHGHAEKMETPMGND